MAVATAAGSAGSGQGALSSVTTYGCVGGGGGGRRGRGEGSGRGGGGGACTKAAVGRTPIRWAGQKGMGRAAADLLHRTLISLKCVAKYECSPSPYLLPPPTFRGHLPTTHPLGAPTCSSPPSPCLSRAAAPWTACAAPAAVPAGERKRERGDGGNEGERWTRPQGRGLGVHQGRRGRRCEAWGLQKGKRG